MVVLASALIEQLKLENKRLRKVLNAARDVERDVPAMYPSARRLVAAVRDYDALVRQ